MHHANTNQQQAGVAMLTSDNVSLRIRNMGTKNERDITQ